MSSGHAIFSYSRIATWKALIRIRVRNDTGLNRDAECLRAGRPRCLVGRLQQSIHVYSTSWRGSHQSRRDTPQESGLQQTAVAVG